MATETSDAVQHKLQLHVQRLQAPAAMHWHAAASKMPLKPPCLYAKKATPTWNRCCANW